jgi:hypothetical protein
MHSTDQDHAKFVALNQPVSLYASTYISFLFFLILAKAKLMTLSRVVRKRGNFVTLLVD